MKKLLLAIFISFTIQGCLPSDNDIEPSFIDNKIIEGNWFKILEYRDSLVYKFNNNYFTIETWDNSTPRKRIHYRDVGHYQITKERLFYSKNPDDQGYSYFLHGDMLTITQPDPVILTKAK